MSATNYYTKVFIALFIMLSTCLLAKPKNVEITYIANEGFLIEIDTHKVLIDALFGHQELSFCEVPDSVQLAMMTKGTGIFEDIDLIAATHNHRDHFHAPFVAEHLHHNPTGIFLSCRQATDALKQETKYQSIASQIITLDVSQRSDTTIGDIHIAALPLPHSPYYIRDEKTGEQYNKHRKIQNLGYLIDLNGIRIFHSGDSSPAFFKAFEHYQLQNEKIDIAMLARGFLATPENVEFTRRFINPDHIILMHLHPDRQQYFRDIAGKLSDIFPSIHIFSYPMEKRLYKIP